MKTHFITPAFLLLIGFQAISQSPAMQLRDGMSIEVLNRTWNNELLNDAKFKAAPKETRDELIAARNEAIISGKTESKRNLVTYKITKEHSPAGMENFKHTAYVIGREQTFHLSVTKDTLFICGSAGLLPFAGEKAGSGFSYEGVQKIPFHLRLNDQLPVYESLQATYPPTKKNIIMGLEETGGTIWTYKGLDKADPELLKICTVTHQTFYEVDAKVGRTEDIVIEGKKYNAFVIESETWTKPFTNETFTSSRKELMKAENKMDRRLNPKFSKENPKTDFTNEAGYTPGYKEEWFVPELGIAKTRVYDKYGAIVNETAIYAIK
ncbi:MAG: hypothetical protein V4635_10750 [Bacteroidota bacterium]